MAQPMREASSPSGSHMRERGRLVPTPSPQPMHVVSSFASSHEGSAPPRLRTTTDCTDRVAPTPVAARSRPALPPSPPLAAVTTAEVGAESGAAPGDQLRSSSPGAPITGARLALAPLDLQPDETLSVEGRYRPAASAAAAATPTASPTAVTRMGRFPPGSATTSMSSTPTRATDSFALPGRLQPISLPTSTAAEAQGSEEAVVSGTQCSTTPSSVASPLRAGLQANGVATAAAPSSLRWPAGSPRYRGGPPAPPTASSPSGSVSRQPETASARCGSVNAVVKSPRSAARSGVWNAYDTTASVASASSRSNSIPRSFNSPVAVPDEATAAGTVVSSSFALPSLPMMPLNPPGRQQPSPVHAMSSLEGAPIVASPNVHRPISSRSATPTSAERDVHTVSVDVPQPPARGLGQAFGGRQGAWSDGHKFASAFMSVARTSSTGDSTDVGVDERPRAGTASAVFAHIGDGAADRTRLGRLGSDSHVHHYAETPKASVGAHPRVAEPHAAFSHTARASAQSRRQSALSLTTTSARRKVARPHFLSSMSTAFLSSTGDSDKGDGSLTESGLFHSGGGGGGGSGRGGASVTLPPPPATPTSGEGGGGGSEFSPPLSPPPPHPLLATVPGHAHRGSVEECDGRDTSFRSGMASSWRQAVGVSPPSGGGSGVTSLSAQIPRKGSTSFPSPADWRLTTQHPTAQPPSAVVTTATTTTTTAGSSAAATPSHFQIPDDWRSPFTALGGAGAFSRRGSVASSVTLSPVPIYAGGDVSRADTVGRAGAPSARCSASCSLPPPPWTPAEALLYQVHNLTPHEQEEIHHYSRIYYCGERAVRLGLKQPRHAPQVAASTTADDLVRLYDQEDHHYRVVIGDHVAYRYEVIDVLGYGTYSVVVRVVDHANGATRRASTSITTADSVRGAATHNHTATGAQSTPSPAQRIGRLSSAAPPMSLPNTASFRGSRVLPSHGDDDRDRADQEASQPRVFAMKIIRNDPQYTAVAEEEVQLHEQLKRAFRFQRQESFRVLKRRASSAVACSWHDVGSTASKTLVDEASPDVLGCGAAAVSPRKRRPPEVQLASFERAEARLEHDAAQGRCTLSQLITHFTFRQHLILLFPLFGMDLGELFRINNRNPFPILITRSFTAQVVHALASVRRAGIIHADIKPENLLLVDRSEEDAELPTFSSCIAKLRNGGRSANGSFDLVEGESQREDPRTPRTASQGSTDQPHHGHPSSTPPPLHTNSITAIPGQAWSPLNDDSGDTDACMVKDVTDLEGEAVGPTENLSAASQSPTPLTLTPTPPPPTALHNPHLAAGAVAAGVARRASVGSVSSRITLIDFSNARPAEAESCFYPIQSQFHRSPEAALRLHYDERMDMWSLGCVLYELITGQTLFPVSSDVELLEHALDVLGMPDRAFLDKIKVFWKAYRAAHPDVGPVRVDRGTPVASAESAVSSSANTGGDVVRAPGEARSEDQITLETCWLALLHMLNRKAAVQANVSGNSNISGRRPGDDDTLISLLVQLGEEDLLVDDETDAGGDGDKAHGNGVNSGGRHTPSAEKVYPRRGTEELVLLMLDFLLGCLFWDAEERLGPEEAMHHPFIAPFFIFPKTLSAPAPSRPVNPASPLSVSPSSKADGAVVSASPHEVRASGAYFLHRHTLTAHRPHLLSRADFYATERATSVCEDVDSEQNLRRAVDGEVEERDRSAAAGHTTVPAVRVYTDDAESHESASRASSASSWESSSHHTESDTSAPLPILRDSTAFFSLTHPPACLPGEERFLCPPVESTTASPESVRGAHAVPLYAAQDTLTAAEILWRDLGTPQAGSSSSSGRHDTLEATPARTDGERPSTIMSGGGSGGTSRGQTPPSRGHSHESSPALARTLPTRYSRFRAEGGLFTDGAATDSLANSMKSPSALRAPPSSLRLTASSNTTSLHHQINQQVLRSVTGSPQDGRAIPASTPPAIGIALSESTSPQVLHLSGSAAGSPSSPPSPAVMALQFD